MVLTGILVVSVIAFAYWVITNAVDRIEKQTKDRQENFDKQFAEQAARLQARDKEIDLLIADIPKRVDLAMSNAVAKFVQPYEELQEDMQGKGVAAKDQDVLHFDVNEEDLREALERLEAGIIS